MVSKVQEKKKQNRTKIFTFNSDNKKLEDVSISYLKQEEIRNNLSLILEQENWSDISLFNYLKTDLFGNITLLSFEEKWKKELETKRQISLLNLYLEDLFKQVLKDGNCKSPVFKILLVYIFNKNKEFDIEEILTNFLNAENYTPTILSVCELLNLYYLDDKDLESVDEIWHLLLHYKRGNIIDVEKDKILDLVLTKNYINFLGLCFFLYKNVSRYKNEKLLRLDRLLCKNILFLKKDEQDTFWYYYKKNYSIWKTFLLMKKIFSKSVIKSVIEDEKKKYGKNDLIRSLNTSTRSLDKLVLQQRFEILKKQNYTYSFNPFELLILLSSFYDSIKKDIKKAQTEVPDSYLVRRAVAVLYFYQAKYKYFLKEIEYIGRFQYLPEIIYLKAISLLEIGESEEGKRILKFLHHQISNSKYLDLVLKKYNIE